MADGDVDFNDLARRIHKLRDQVPRGAFIKVYSVIDELRELPFPPGYLDELRTDMFKVLQRGKAEVSTYVYLSFYGMDSKASHMKIGIAKSVKNRLSSIRTGNPLPRLWTYAARFPDRETALAVETALLQHMSADKAHGEWVNVHGLSEPAARAVSESLAEIATQVHGHPAAFERVEG